ncbi:MAG: HAMP domain-containing histidine kinase [Cytophagales bacterium]|nr:HAMP domain-containing histidine kinase [Cytophaga sp.]
MVLLVTSLVFVQCLTTGLGSMVFCYYMPLLIGIPFIIDHKKMGLLLIHMLIPVLLCTYLLFGNAPFADSVQNLSEGFTNLNGRVNTICALIQCGFFAWLIIRDHSISQKLAIVSKLKIEKRNQDLIKTNKEMDHLVYSISHDLRSPIASALGLIEISKLEDDIEKLRYYETLKESCLRRLDHFIIDILNYLKNNRLEIEISHIDIRQEISFAIEMNSGYNEHMTVSIENAHTGDFYTDKNRLRIILNNLISNAYRYAKHGSDDRTITIITKNSGSDLIITISDNGVGINEEYMDKIFDMFFKTDEKSKGSGLGLYITKEALDRLNGTIEVWSEKGVGSSFTIKLPNMKKVLVPVASEEISI